MPLKHERFYNDRRKMFGKNRTSIINIEHTFHSLLIPKNGAKM